MILPLDILARFVRQSVYNLSRRKRLDDSESNQTAYSLRKSRLTKLIDKHRYPSSNFDEFLSNIFFSTTLSDISF